MTICRICVLDENFPGIRFNEEGVCQFCTRQGASGPRDDVKARYAEKFHDIVEKVRGRGSYDVLMAFSGGKDSTYTLKLLKEDMALRVIAMVFDHGFVSPRALENIDRVCESLSVDLVAISPDRDLLKRSFVRSLEKDIYPIKSLERASSICNTCMHMAKSLFTRHAIEMDIPLIAYGWSPGQAPVQSSVMKLNPAMLRQSQDMMVQSLRKVLGEIADSYLLGERHYTMLEEQNRRYDNSFLYNIHPLAFFEYSEPEILRSITALRWEAPSDTDANSTNCLLNAFANLSHFEEHGFHPYAFEVAGLVREGYMSRDEGLEKLGEPVNDDHIVDIRQKLGISN